MLYQFRALCIYRDDLVFIIYLFLSHLCQKHWEHGYWLGISNFLIFCVHNMYTQECKLWCPSNQNRTFNFLSIQNMCIYNICFIKNRSKLSSVLLMCLLRIFMKQSLLYKKTRNVSWNKLVDSKCLETCHEQIIFECQLWLVKRLEN